MRVILLVFAMAAIVFLGSAPRLAAPSALNEGSADAVTPAERGADKTVLRSVEKPGARRGCADLRRALAYYRRWTVHWRSEMGLKTTYIASPSCPVHLAKRWQQKARTARLAYLSWNEYHHHWWKWLPDKWQRIGACETGYGKRPGRWDWNSGTYQGAFGFYHGSWDAFVPRADRRAGPYPSEAYLATPRQQYEVAMAIYRMYGFSGWGCRGA